ncbi:LPXTG cell wall anchor domain-containing protein [Bacillus sp. SG-1]|uniref:LPXTG cell wall anchor domain-containing protein n=1 Tax=Bacillus sp. SG-1 TaxID=161544 RepID=UPI0001543042|nr:LPXTG cell wall anchor domain-containing protein [Bacillus sp. SG-1]EDL64913.1 hypothetical protein BSG1_20345 [Bacillus sp. SG-1]
MKKNSSKILPLTLSTTLTLFSFSALPAAANTNEETNAPVNVLNETKADTEKTAELKTAETSTQTEADSNTEAAASNEEQTAQEVTSEEANADSEEATEVDQPAKTDDTVKETTETGEEANVEDAEAGEASSETDSDIFELVKAILTGEISAAALVLTDGSRVNLGFENGTWTCLNSDILDDVAGLEVETAGETYTFLYADLLEEISAYVAAWINANVTIAEEEEPAELLTDVNVVLHEDVTVQAASLQLEDGTLVGLDVNNDYAIVGDTEVEADSVTKLWLTIEGEEYEIDLSDVEAENGVLTITVTADDLDLDVDLVTEINLTLPEDIEAEEVKLVLADGTLVELEESDDDSYVLLTEDNVSVDEIVQLWLSIDGEEFTIDLDDIDLDGGVLNIEVEDADLDLNVDLVTEINLSLPNDVEAEEVKLVLADGTLVELEESDDDSYVLLTEDDVSVDEIVQLWLSIDGEEFTIDLDDLDLDGGLLSITVEEADLDLNVDLVTEINLSLPNDIEAEEVKLVLADGTLVELEESDDDSYVLLTEDNVSVDEIVQLWLSIDGEEFTIDLDDLDLDGGLLSITVEEADLDLNVDLVTEINLSLPNDVEAEEVKLVLADGTLVELEESDEDYYVLGTEVEVSIDEIVQLWLLIDGEEFTIDLDDLDLEEGVLNIEVDEADLELDLTAVTEINLTLPEEIEIDDAELVLVDGTVIELEVTDELTFLFEEELYLENIAYLSLTVDGAEYTVDLSEADLEEGVLSVGLDLDVFFDAVTELDLNLPEGLDIEGATVRLTDGSLIDLEVTEDLLFLFEDGELYLQNVAALWLVIDGEEIEIDLTEWDYEVSGEGLLSITLPEDFLDSLVDDNDTEVEFLTGLTINLLNFTGDIDSAVLIYGDNDRLDLDIVDGTLVLNLEDLELELEDLLDLEIVIDGETYLIDFDEDSLTEVDGEVTFDIDFDVDIDEDSDSDTDTDSDTDNDSDSDSNSNSSSDTDETIAGKDSDNDTKKSGMLPYTGESSNLLFYLTGLLISAFGVLNLRKRKLNKE